MIHDTSHTQTDLPGGSARSARQRAVLRGAGLLRLLAGSALFGLLLGLALAAVGMVLFGSMRAFEAFELGETFFVPEEIKNVAVTAPGKPAKVEFVVQNVSFSPATLYGAQSDCAVIHDMPMDFAPLSKRTLAVEVLTSPSEAGTTKAGRVRLLTNARGSPLVLRVNAAIAAINNAE